jgi:hypothetical protein
MPQHSAIAVRRDSFWSPSWWPPPNQTNPISEAKFLLRRTLAVRCNNAEFFGKATITAEVMAGAKAIEPRGGLVRSLHKILMADTNRPSFGGCATKRP